MTTAEAPTLPVTREAHSAMPRILRVAADLFAQQGYDSVSMNAIAEKAGVSKANIFHHFKSKHDLYIQVLREACRESREMLESIDLNGGDARDALKDYAAHQLLTMLHNEQDTQLIHREVIHNSPDRARQLAEDVFQEGFTRLVETLRESQARCVLRADLSPVHLAIFMLSANVFFSFSREILRHLPGVDIADDPERYSDQYMDILLRGAAPDPN